MKLSEGLAGHRFAFAIPPLVTLLLGLATVNSVQVGSIQDDAWYLVTADALARSLGFVRPWTADLMVETRLPPGLPLLLSPLRSLFPDSFLPAQFLSLAATVGTVVLCGWYYRRHETRGMAWLLALLLAVNVGVIGSSTQVMSEAIYTFLIMVIVALGGQGAGAGGRRWTTYAAIGLLAVAAYFVRSWGLAMVGALAVFFALRRLWLAAALALLPFAVGYGAWSLRNAAAGGVGATYGIAANTVVPFVQRFTVDLPDKLATHWLHDLPQWFLTPRTTFTLDAHGLGWLALLAGALVLAPVVIGYVTRLRRGVALPEVFVLAHAAIVSVAPMNARYWLPVVPFLLAYFVEGLREVVGWVGGARQQARMPGLQARGGQARMAGVVALALLALIGLHGVRDVQDVFDPPRLRVPDIAIGPAWIADHTPADALVLVNTPRVSYLYGQRTMLPFPDGRGEVFDAYPDLAAAGKQDRLLQVLAQYPLQYLLVEPALGQHPPFEWSDYVRQVVVATLEADKARFRMVFSDDSGMVRVYHVER